MVGRATAPRPLIFYLYIGVGFAGCPYTERSTSGVYAIRRGGSTRFPVFVVSNRPGCVSSSILEDELAAAEYGIRDECFSRRGVCDVIFQKKCVSEFHAENKAMFRVAEVVDNFTCDFSSAFVSFLLLILFEITKRPDVDVMYEYISRASADIFTEPFSMSSQLRSEVLLFWRCCCFYLFSPSFSSARVTSHLTAGVVPFAGRLSSARAPREVDFSVPSCCVCVFWGRCRRSLGMFWVCSQGACCWFWVWGHAAI